MRLQTVSKICTDKGSPKFSTTRMECENGLLRNEGEILMLTVSQTSKALLVLLNILEGKKLL